MSDLATIAEEHIRAALSRAEAAFPVFPVDSWSDPAVPGQYVVTENDEGRRSQVVMDRNITRGVTISPGSVSRSCGRLVQVVLDELRPYVSGGELVVSRPLPDPERDDVHCAHVEFKGVWFRLIVRGDAVVLSAVLGKAPVPLAEPAEAVVWL